MPSHSSRLSDNSHLPIVSDASHILTRNFARPQRIALIAQGGGQRGIFTSGVLDSFMQAGFDPFELYIGTSAGALNISAYLGRQQGFGHKFITEYTSQARFFNLLKYVRRQQFMDLDWALDVAMTHEGTGLDLATIRKTLAGRSAYASATDANMLKPAFFPLFKDDGPSEDWLTVLKATCAIPFLYPSTVEIDQVKYVDGGVCAAIPVKEAFYRGADIIVVIRTEPKVDDNNQVTSTFIENLRDKMETNLPQYLERLNMNDRFDKLESFHSDLSGRLKSIAARYHENSADPFWAKLKEMLPPSKWRNGGRWLFGGDHLYRLQAISGQRLNADMINMLTSHYQTYQESLSFMAKPPARVELIQIAPETPLVSSPLLSKPYQLEHDYQDGRDAGQRFIETLGDKLSHISSVSSYKED